MLDLFKTPELRYRTIIVCIVFIANALVYYGLVIGMFFVVYLCCCCSFRSFCFRASCCLCCFHLLLVLFLFQHFRINLHREGFCSRVTSSSTTPLPDLSRFQHYSHVCGWWSLDGRGTFYFIFNFVQIFLVNFFLHLFILFVEIVQFFRNIFAKFQAVIHFF